MEKEKKTYKLPEGWIEVTLDEIAILSTGNTPSKKISKYYGGDFPFYKPSDLNTGIVSSVNETLTEAGKSVARIIPRNSILVTSIGATIGKTGLVKKAGAFNQQINAIIPILSLPLFYYYQILGGEFQRKIIENSSATTVPIINKSKFGKLTLKLPPLIEQQRIVLKIESLFSELDQAEKGLQKSKQQLEIYRQALLKKAFTGGLSKKCRNENIKKGNNNAGELPSSWNYQKIINLTSFVGSGSTPKGGRNIYIEDGIPFIRSQNILVNRFVQDDLVFISSDIHDKMKRTQIKPKDVLLNITGASIGRSAYIPKSFIDGNVNQHVCIIRINPELIQYKYLTFFLNSPEAQLKIMQINKGVTREALNLSQIKEFKVPICDIHEQGVIIQILESELTLIDNLSNTIDKSFKEIVSLRHSILKRAFEGKLVQQDITEESVQKLLESIKREKIEYLKAQKEALLQKPKRNYFMYTDKTVWQILSSTGIAIRTAELWKDSKHKNDIDAFYAEVKELVDSGKVIEEKREGKVSFLKAK